MRQGNVIVWVYLFLEESELEEPPAKRSATGDEIPVKQKQTVKLSFRGHFRICLFNNTTPIG